MATDPPPYRPRRLTLQWHITERCNLACHHCYQEPERHEAPLGELLGHLDQFLELLSYYRTLAPAKPLKGHINLTGGEPFSHPEIFALLEQLHAHRELFSFALLSNGSALDDKTTQRLAQLKPRFVQLSLDGSAVTHDALRGAGDHARVCRTAERLGAAGIPVLLSFTAQRRNYRDFPEVAATARRLGVRRIWADRFVPLGGAAQEQSQVLNPQETRELFWSMQRARRRWLPWRRTEVAMHRALQFQCGDGRPYRCHAGGELISLMANGDLVPCRRLPLVVGNLHNASLRELYRSAPLFEQLRAPLPSGHPCAPCTYANACRGGLRCLSHARTGSWQSRDPGCDKGFVSSF